LRAFPNRSLRKIFGPKMDEVREGWRKLHDKELHDLYSSPNNSRRIKLKGKRCVGLVACQGVWLKAGRKLPECKTYASHGNGFIWLKNGANCGPLLTI